MGYLRTCCVEAVVHGMGLTPPVEPDDVALTVTAERLLAVLCAQSSELLRHQRYGRSCR